MYTLSGIIIAVYPVTILLLAIILERYIIRKSSSEHKQIQRFVT